MEQAVTRKKLIEVSLPLEAINIAAAHEKMPGIGPHPRGLHLWWARRPLAAARAVLFAQMVDDPSSRPELFPTEEAQFQERQRLFGIIENLVQWKSTSNETVLESARKEIRQAWELTCEDNRNHPQSSELFNPNRLPAFHDPFAGGGALPMEAQRLGLHAYASDLNPVAALINKAMIEIPPRFSGRPPVNPEVRQGKGSTEAAWKGTAGLAEDVRYYGKWVRDEAEKRIGDLYPKVEVTEEMVRDRSDLKPYLGRNLNVIAWLWARTVKSPNPAFADVDVPLASSFVLSKKGNGAYVQPVIEDLDYRFTVKVGTPPSGAKNGTKSGGSGSSFLCLLSGVPMPFEYLRSEAKAGRMGARMMAVVAEGDRGRIYLAPTLEQEAVALNADPADIPDTNLPDRALGFRVQEYGMNKWRELFTHRQLVALSTLSDLVGKAQEVVRKDAMDAVIENLGEPLRQRDNEAAEYAKAVAMYLAFGVDRCADFSNTCTRWVPSNEKGMNLFGKQAIAMTWDFPEVAILNQVVGGFVPATEYISHCIEKLPQHGRGQAKMQNAMTGDLAIGKIVSTDPPYYDNIGYADLSDFFYFWLRLSLRQVFPDLFTTLTVPKADELVATPHRHKNKEEAEKFFLDGMTLALQRLVEQSHPAFPNTIFYAFKQSEKKGDLGAHNTGWETFLDAVIHSGYAISGTWPMRSEQEYRMVGMNTNALASSIILVCRPLPSNAEIGTRRDFIDALKAELPEGLRKMQAGNIAPVDLAQAAIGPGMAVFTRYSRVLDAGGAAVTVRDALSLINQTLDEVLADQEGEFDADTRWALAWFEQSGFDPGDFGVAETLSKAKNTSVSGMVEAGILESGGGRVRLLQPEELSAGWQPDDDSRRTAWESVHHLVGTLNQESEGAAATLLSKLGSDAETVRDLAYRLYRICEQKNRPQEALGYNALVRSWGEISELAQRATVETQATMFERE